MYWGVTCEKSYVNYLPLITAVLPARLPSRKSFGSPSYNVYSET